MTKGPVIPLVSFRPKRLKDSREKGFSNLKNRKNMGKLKGRKQMLGILVFANFP